MPRFRFTNLVLLIALSSTSHAIDLSENLTLNGFGTIGMMHNDDENAVYRRDISQPGAAIDQTSFKPDSRLGLQLEYQINDKFSATLQAVSKLRYDKTFEPEVSWAFIKYNPQPELDIRAGRLGVDLFFRSDSRDIGYSYLWVRPPVDYYGLIWPYRLDGMDINKYFNLGDGIFRIKGYYGWNDQKVPGVYSTNDFNDSPIYGVLGEYADSKWNIKANIARIEFNGEDPDVTLLSSQLRVLGNIFSVPQAINLADDLQMIDKKITYYSLGFAYDTGPWRTQFAASHTASEMLVIPDTDAAYLSIGYNIKQWTPYISYSLIKSDSTQVSSGLGPLVDAQVNQMILSETESDQRTLSLGARYDFAHNMALKFQIDHVESEIGSSLLWGPVDADWDQENTIFSITLDFVF